MNILLQKENPHFLLLHPVFANYGEEAHRDGMRSRVNRDKGGSSHVKFASCLLYTMTEFRILLVAFKRPPSSAFKSF